MIFPTGRHHGQDVVLATPSATLNTTQDQLLHQHAMGDTALACFGPTKENTKRNNNKATISTMTVAMATSTATTPTTRMVVTMAAMMKVT
jgi:hypothetical protein